MPSMQPWHCEQPFQSPVLKIVEFDQPPSIASASISAACPHSLETCDVIQWLLDKPSPDPQTSQSARDGNEHLVGFRVRLFGYGNPIPTNKDLPTVPSLDSFDNPVKTAIVSASIRAETCQPAGGCVLRLGPQLGTCLPLISPRQEMAPCFTHVDVQ